MFVIVEPRQEVRTAYVAAFRDERAASLSFNPAEFSAWFATVALEDLDAVRCFLLGDFPTRNACPQLIRRRSGAAIIALADVRSLESTLELFGAGIDDVVRKPVHVREIMARAAAIWRRPANASVQPGARLQVFFDGRDPEVDGVSLALPRRERVVLEFLVKNAHRRVTKTQVFKAVYGLLDRDVDEAAVEGHISRLRKKLRMLLGHDVVDAIRYLGYQFVGEGVKGRSQAGAVRALAPPPVQHPGKRVPVAHVATIAA